MLVYFLVSTMLMHSFECCVTRCFKNLVPDSVLTGAEVQTVGAFYDVDFQDLKYGECQCNSNYNADLTIHAVGNVRFVNGSGQYPFKVIP